MSGHQTVTGKQVQEFMSRESGVDFTRVFEQYLTTTKVPVLEYKVTGDSVSFRWNNVVSGFVMPVRVTLDGSGGYSWIKPTEAWQTARFAAPALKVDDNFYVTAKQTDDKR